MILGFPLAIILSEVALANLGLGWTHIVISEPSSKYWFCRIPSFSSWKKVVRPTFISATAEQVAVFLPLYLAQAWGLGTQSITPENGRDVSKKAMVVGLISLVSTFLVVIPAKVTLTRVQASLLPEDQETIVPFDRSFGGKVVPEVVGGTGMIGLLDAWKTFGFHSRIRLIKLYVKIFAVQVLTIIVYMMAIVGLLVSFQTKHADKPVGQEEISF
jgi:hypothetical protein